MDTLIVIALVGLAAALAIAALSFGRRTRADAATTPVDPEVAERWIVRHAPARLRPVMRHLDRHVVGGAAVAVGFVLVLAAALAVGWLLDSVDEGSGFARWDDSAAEWGARNATETSTDALELVTELGGTVPLLLVMAAIGVYDLARRHNVNVLLYLVTVGLGITLVNNGVKLWVDRERPDIAQLVGWSGPSFPSGHSAAAAACWAAIALVLTRHLGRTARVGGAALAVAIAVVVAASRVLLGVHWLTDVIAGVIVGWTWFLLVSIAFGGRLVRLGEPAERIAAGDAEPLPQTLETEVR